MYEQRAKLLKKAGGPTHHDSGSQLKHAKTSGVSGAHQVRKAGASPSKKLGTTSALSLNKSSSSTLGGSGGNVSPLVKGGSAIIGAPNGGIQISKIVESMLDKICPNNLAASEGLGTDNMTCIVIEFVKPD